MNVFEKNALDNTHQSGWMQVLIRFTMSQFEKNLNAKFSLYKNLIFFLETQIIDIF